MFDHVAAILQPMLDACCCLLSRHAGATFDLATDRLPGVAVYVIDGFLNNATVIQGMLAAGLLPLCYIRWGASCNVCYLRCGRLASCVSRLGDVVVNWLAWAVGAD